ncbi:YgjP-like metallopeptidase domain-containing protein [Mycoplasmopsis gallopavonis]|uniref:Protein of uncharacterized function DUF45 n=1 Tax=Mycoplasmopsis gallopavonis TaxID=76629 RepID=A0A449AYN6_9BACT|nr:YgjP-like metallopeptidase domain-containing protein [Mycoplasmopsis gallopavonis]RIV16679.1 DUF45 domain-containing protein [Mycoplasmopsis gallopavonis]VEU72648.1 Protein of uncharacterised function DUF45 [Mycoplasmopsis gallopavonis]
MKEQIKSISFDDKIYYYKVTESTSKTSKARINKGELEIIFSKNLDQKKREVFIKESIEELKETWMRHYHKPLKSYKNTFSYFGKIVAFRPASKFWPVLVLYDVETNEILFSHPDLLLTIDQNGNYLNEQNQVKIAKWLKSELFVFLEQTQRKLEKKLGIDFYDLFVRDKVGTWGTNHVSKKAIYYNFHLHIFNKEIIEAVVLHELAHHFYHGHGTDFYDFVVQHCPNYKKIADELNLD